MGDVVDFKRKKSTIAINSPKLDFAAFKSYYEANIDFVDNLATFILINGSKELDIGEINGYDMFMLRESVMSLAMRSRGLYHPLQELTDEYYVFFRDTPPEEPA